MGKAPLENFWEDLFLKKLGAKSFLETSLLALKVLMALSSSYMSSDAVSLSEYEILNSSGTR